MKKLFISIFIGVTLLIPSASFAAEEKFFEFTADVGVPIEVSSGSVALQDFKIYNDVIDAVDLWYDNTGSSGSVTVALLNASDAVLVSKTVTVPYASAFYTGQRLHITFPDTVAVSSGSWYRLRITSNVSKLRIYGINRVQFVEHNAPSFIADAVGNAMVDEEQQSVAFKFVLYEEIDTEAPIITNVSAAIWSFDAVKIAFNANELVDRSLLYGPIGAATSTIAYSGSYSVCFEGVRLCSFTIDTVRGTPYVYRLFVRDSMGNESYSDGTFESWGQGAPVPPADPALPPAAPPAEPVSSEEPPLVPLAIANARITSVTPSSIQLSWDTNRAANSTMIISSDPVGLQAVANVADGVYELAHTISVSRGITAGTDYYASIISRDMSGGMAAQVIPFTSASYSTGPEQASSPINSSTPLSASVFEAQGTVSVSWGASSAGEPNNGYRIDIIDAQGNLIETRIISAGVHSAVISDLVEGDYSVIVYADTDGVVEKIALPATVSVKKNVGPIDTYALIKKPIVYIPFIGFIVLVAGLYWYSRRMKKVVRSK